jgi:hypothetical protein
MQDLDSAAKEKGIIILNESGLDPGIDHMSAMRVIDHIHDKGGKVEEFFSICGLYLLRKPPTILSAISSPGVPRSSASR